MIVEYTNFQTDNPESGSLRWFGGSDFYIHDANGTEVDVFNIADAVGDIELAREIAKDHFERVERQCFWVNGIDYYIIKNSGGDYDVLYSDDSLAFNVRHDGIEGYVYYWNGSQLQYASESLLGDEIIKVAEWIAAVGDE